MSLPDPPEMNEADELDGLRDPVLRRALDNAPDRSAEPSHELRRKIQKAAHRAVEPKPETIDLDESIWRIWWRRLGGGGRMGWSAGFATLLVAGFVTLLWQREPVPQARLDSDRRAAPLPAPAAPPPPSAAPESTASAESPAPPPASPPQQEPAPAAPAAAEAPGPVAQVPPPPVPAEPPSISMPPSAGAPPPSAPPSGAPPAGAATQADPLAPLARQEAQPPSRPGQSAARGAANELPADEVRESESKAKAAAAPPPPVAAAPLPKPAPPPALPAPAPAAPAPPLAQAAPPGAGATEQRAAGRARDEAAPAPQRAAPPPATRNEGTAPPSFAALSQWRRVTILRTDGASRNLAREEVGELVPLLGSAALVAVGAQPLPDEVEWRVVLERANGDRLAVLDIAGNWVRWREGRAPPGTGAPSAGAVAALREALREALER